MLPYKSYNRADLPRIRGGVGICSDRFERAGVDTVKKLAARNTVDLHTAYIHPHGA
jgi:hypothetical protein